MIIALVDQSTIRLAFAYSAATVAYVKALPGAEYDGDSKSWTVSLCALRRVIDHFHGCTVPGEVVAARLDMWRRWVQQHNACGVWFALDHDAETVVAVGAGVSPLFAEYVRERSAILRQFLGDQVWPDSRPLLNAPAYEPTDADRQMWEAIQGGFKAEQRKKEQAERRAPRWAADTKGRADMKK